MHPYMPNDEEIDEMLGYLGLSEIGDLFVDIPGQVKIDSLPMDQGMGEIDVIRELHKIGAKNWSACQTTTFLGGGIYNHYVPPAVGEIISRGEFYTSYTPYQAEISQGMLQTLFEYQSMVSALTGMDIANSSMYDAATGLGEAALMANRITKRDRVLVPEVMDPDKFSTLENYVRGVGMEIERYSLDRETGMHDISSLDQQLDPNTAAVYMECPNYLGIMEENIALVKEMLDDKTVLIAGINPISLGLIKKPGDYGADVVVGEGQPLGLGMNFGGPLLGIFAARVKHMRFMPGRIIGMTEDTEGNRAYTMTLQTREQHIRREKATSNICSNEALCAVATAVYLSLFGKNGLRNLAALNYNKAHSLMDRLCEIDGLEREFSGDFFNEFVISLDDVDISKFYRHMLDRKIHPGIKLEDRINDFPRSLMVAVTEMNTKQEMDDLVEGIRTFHGGGE